MMFTIFVFYTLFCSAESKNSLTLTDLVKNGMVYPNKIENPMFIKDVTDIYDCIKSDDKEYLACKNVVNMTIKYDDDFDCYKNNLKISYYLADHDKHMNGYLAPEVIDNLVQSVQVLSKDCIFFRRYHVNNAKALIQLDDNLFIVAIDTKEKIDNWIKKTLYQTGHYLKLVLYYFGYLDTKLLELKNYDLFQDAFITVVLISLIRSFTRSNIKQIIIDPFIQARDVRCKESIYRGAYDEMTDSELKSLMDLRSKTKYALSKK